MELDNIVSEIEQNESLTQLLPCIAENQQKEVTEESPLINVYYDDTIQVRILTILI